MKKLLLLIAVFSFVGAQQLNQWLLPKSEILNESPLYPLPSEMTFEEYQIMNRRLSVGILLSAIPIPGMMHDYAGEKEKAKKIRYIAAGCISAMILGATSHQKGDFPKSDFDKHIINTLFEMEKSGAF